MHKFPYQVAKLITELEKANHKAYVVGGAVRDILLHKKPHDYDIATSATPDEALAVAKKNNWQTVDRLGKNFGTVIIVVNGMNIEVTTFRGERYDRDSHRPAEIWIARNLQEDCKRRDFTINAMAMDLHGILYDFHNGRQDLEAGILRTVGNAKQRFSEDALRMFRACRFVAELGFKYVDDCFPKKNFGTPGTPYYLENCPVFDTSKCNGLSVERIKAELDKLLCADFAGIGLAMLEGTGLADAQCQIKLNGVTSTIDILPELNHLVGLKQNPQFHQYDVWEHTLKAIDNSPEVLSVRWALLCHDLGKGLPNIRDLNKEGQPRDAGHEKESAEMTKNILKRMNYPNSYIKKVKFLVEHHMRFAGFMRDNKNNHTKTETSILRWLRGVATSPEKVFKHEKDMADATVELVNVYLADMGATIAGGNRQIMENGRELGAQVIQLARVNMPVSTGDLNLSGPDFEKFPKNINMKRALSYLLERVQAGDLHNDRNALMEALLNKYKRIMEVKYDQNKQNHHTKRHTGCTRRRSVRSTTSKRQTLANDPVSSTISQ